MADELEHEIAAYRRALGPSVDPVDADELEDHLRALIAELRDAGRDAEVAFAEAVRRVGEPRALAREYARVTRVFGAPLPRARAWSAAALLLPTVAWSVWQLSAAGHSPLWLSAIGLMVVLEAALIAGVIAGRTWARAGLLGHVVPCAVGSAMTMVLEPGAVGDLLPFVIASGGAAAFLLPWRRGELTPRGWALAGLGFSLASLDRSIGLHHPIATTLLFSMLLGGAGLLRRARWATPVLLLAALAALPGLHMQIAYAEYIDRPSYLPQVLLSAVGMVTLVAAAVLSWRGGRSWRGTTDALAR